MKLDGLFAAIDDKPFRIELPSGTQVDVAHLENVFMLSHRQKVHTIQVYQDEPYAMSRIWPEGRVRLLYPENQAPAAGQERLRASRARPSPP